MAHYSITVEGVDEPFLGSDQETLLVSLDRSARKQIFSGCRGGGCGICKVEIISGQFVSKRMSRCHVSESDEGDRRLLACQVIPRSDVVLRVVGAMQKRIA